jgi:hypothetical protein
MDAEHVATKMSLSLAGAAAAVDAAIARPQRWGFPSPWLSWTSRATRSP